jgi:glutaredoxin-like YruB-family protein
MIALQSNDELVNELRRNKKSFVLIYKADSTTSSCALENIESVSQEMPQLFFYTVDVSTVRDIHQKYNITSVPTLLEFHGEELRNVIKGCQDKSYLKAYFDNAIFVAKSKVEGKPKHSVTVYTTPTCSWCTTIKNYLKKNAIAFREVDVSKDSSAAEAMVKRSGQQGVPQSLIDGQVVVGFDQGKIDSLLGIS